MDGVGIVRTQRILVADADDPLDLVCGRQLDHVEVAYETYGRLNDAGDNTVFICHALTADAHAAGISEETGKKGWWDSLIGPGRAIDTERYFVVCANLLGSCLGSTGPTSIDPATGKPYGLGFPPIEISDQVDVYRRLCARLGVRGLHALIGPSLGGMHALQWYLAHPEEVARTIIIASSSRLTVENRAFSAAGRLAILDDPGFEDGMYLETGGSGPQRGLAAARRFAHITYLSGDALEQKLGDELPEDWPPREAAHWLSPAREVERYLEYQGNSFMKRFDALSYLFLTRPMDDFEPFHRSDEPAAAIARNPGARHVLISFDSDWRFGTSHSIRLEKELIDAGATDVHRHELVAPWGHDSFLLDAPGLDDLIAGTLAS